jgi:hypothetical protein
MLMTQGFALVRLQAILLPFEAQRFLQRVLLKVRATIYHISL